MERKKFKDQLLEDLVKHINSRKVLKRIFDELGWDFGEKRRQSYQPKTSAEK